MSETEVTHDTQVENTDDLDAFTTDFFGEKKVDTANAKAEVEQDGKEVDGDESTEAQTTDTELTDEDEATAEAELAAAKPKSKVQERIDELVKQRHEAERAADKKIAELRAEFESALKTREPAKVEQKVAEPQPDTLNEDGSPKYPLGDFDPAYIRDLTKFTLEQERNQANIIAEEKRQFQEQANQKATLMNSWNEKMGPAKEKYPDLAEKGTELLNGFSHLDPNYAEYLSTVLMSMDYGPDVLHYLSNNRDEATKIVNSGAQKATLALGRIEAKFVEEEQTKLLAKPKVSKAPPPPTATARGTGGGAQSVPVDTDDLDAFTKEFFRKRK